MCESCKGIVECMNLSCMCVIYIYIESLNFFFILSQLSFTFYVWPSVVMTALLPNMCWLYLAFGMLGTKYN